MSKTTSMSDYLTRDLNVAFSGGERKRCEAFQLLLQKPLLSMLDEPESGVDLQSVRVLGKALSSLQNRDIGGRRSATISKHLLSASLLVITHTGGILEYMHGTIAHVLIDGHIACTGNEYVFLRMIQNEGFEWDFGIPLIVVILEICVVIWSAQNAVSSRCIRVENGGKSEE